MIEGYRLEPRSAEVTSAFTRVSTVVRLRGAGHEGLGEDVTYDAGGPRRPARGAARCCRSPARTRSRASRATSTGSTCSPSPPAALRGLPQLPPLGLRERRARPRAAPGRPLARRRARAHAAAGHLRRLAAARRAAEPRPGAGAPGARPGACASSSTPRRAGTTRCSSASPRPGPSRRRLQGRLQGHAGRRPAPTPALYRARGAARFPAPGWRTPTSTRPTPPRCSPRYRDRVTWDAPIHSVAECEALPFAPRTLNCKPSRFGPLRALLDFYDHCEAEGIGLYGGGQSELGRARADPVPGRAVSPRRAERHRPPRLQRPGARARPALQPAPPGAVGHRLPLGRGGRHGAVTPRVGSGTFGH